MIDTHALRRKYAPRPTVTASRTYYWTPAGSKDVYKLCDELDKALAEGPVPLLYGTDEAVRAARAVLRFSKGESKRVPPVKARAEPLKLLSQSDNEAGAKKLLSFYGLQPVREEPRMAAPPAASPGATGLPHFAPKAKQIIFLTQSGGPSQHETFDPKPVLNTLHGQHVPASFGSVQLNFSKFEDGDQKIFAVVDTEIGAWDFNAGIGYGYGDPEDRWTLKLIIGTPLGK